MEKGLWVDHSSFLIARILVGETPQSASREVSSLHPVVPLDPLNLISTVELMDEIDHIQKYIRNEGAQRCVEVALESPSPGLRKT